MQDEVTQAADLLTKAIGDISAALTMAGKADKIAEWTAPYVAAVNAMDDQAERETLARMEWRPIEGAPKDGTHFLACTGGYGEHWTFNQRPPVVVHYWSNPGEEGFYLSTGLVEGSYNDVPCDFQWWKPLGPEPLPPAPVVGQ